jgi:hypothetical protein
MPRFDLRRDFVEDVSLTVARLVDFRERLKHLDAMERSSRICFCFNTRKMH